MVSHDVGVAMAIHAPVLVPRVRALGDVPPNSMLIVLITRKHAVNQTLYARARILQPEQAHSMPSLCQMLIRMCAHMHQILADSSRPTNNFRLHRIMNLDVLYGGAHHPRHYREVSTPVIACFTNVSGTCHGSHAPPRPPRPPRPPTSARTHASHATPHPPRPPTSARARDSHAHVAPARFTREH